MQTQIPVAGESARKPASRWFQVAALVFAVICAGNGVAMLFDPAQWFQVTPGAAETGAFNPHLVRDVGIAFLAAALCYPLALWRPAASVPLTLVAAVFLSGHGLLHLAEAGSGHHAGDPAGLVSTVGLGVIALVLLLAAGRIDRQE